MSTRVLLFMTAPPGAGEPLRIAVPCVAAAEPLLLEVIRANAPSGTREVAVELGPEGPEAELALIDYWTDMPGADRDRVWAAAGPLAGALARFDDRRSRGFAVLSRTPSDTRPINGQTRSLLMAAHADTWTLALDREPGVDADVWRARLATALDLRWTVAQLDQPAGVLAGLVREWTLAGKAPAAVAGDDVPLDVPSTPDGTVRAWLDRELLALVADRARVAVAGSHRDTTPSQPAAADDAPRAVRGRRSRLFLASDSHDSHRQILGQRPLAPADLDAWEQGTAARVAWLSARGCRFVHLIGPAPQVVHADDLPPGLAPSPSRPARQLLERLGGGAPLLYPMNELAAARAHGSPFSLTDSHWNDLGAYVAYEAVLAHLGDGAHVRRVERSDVTFQDTVYVGDLGGKLHPDRASIFLRARVHEPRARIVEDNRVRNHGRRVVYECAAAPPTTCVVFGDSWAYPMMLFLAETFRRTVFQHRVNVVDRRPVDAERPDVVLVVLTERFCDAVPNDAHAVDFDQFAARKVRKGDLVPLPRPGQLYEFLYSLALDRQLADRPGLRLPVLAVSGRGVR